MKDYKISNTIKVLRKEKNYTISGLADECGIGLRGFNKWLKKTDREWSIDSLMILSEILDFKITINGGMIEIMRNYEELNSLEKNNKEIYSVYKDFGDYSIVNLYTPNSNLNFDDIPELLEEFFVFSSEMECKREFPDNNPVKMYGLLNNKTNCIELERLTSIYPYKAESYYYFHLAPTIAYTEDNYEIVAEFEDIGYKLVKAGALLEKVNNDSYEVEEFTNNLRDDRCIPGFTLLPTYLNNSKDFSGWSENLEFLYSSYDFLNNKCISNRYFDRNRNEIFNDDVIINKGFNPNMEDIFDDEYFNGIDNYFGNIDKYYRKGESIRVEKVNGNLGFDIKGNWFFLDKINLLKWEKAVYEE